MIKRHLAREETREPILQARGGQFLDETLNRQAARFRIPAADQAVVRSESFTENLGRRLCLIAIEQQQRSTGSVNRPRQ